MTAPYGAAMSEHPLATHATGEVIGQVLEAVGPAPDLAVLFVTAAHTGALAEMAETVRKLLQPTTLLAVTAVSVLAGGREVEEQPAVSLWAGNVGGVPTPVRLEMVPGDDGLTVRGLPPEAADGPRTLVLLADPFQLPVDTFVAELASTHPQLQVVGGVASAARAPGGNRLVLDSCVFTDGAVGALLPAGAPVSTVVSQGCRPIGTPMIVTKAEGQIVYALAGQRALDRLTSLVEAMTVEDRGLVQNGLHVGRVIDERKATFGRGDFLIRNILGGDRDVGALAVGDEVPVGATLQFHVRDAESADQDLRELLDGRSAAGALVFTCNGRGMHFFGRPDHDAEVVAEQVGPAVAGMFCAGELGPVGERSFLHGFTASILLFA
ncbi:MAG: FIST N-terminal domain-containing protein [Acidimicrobiales bacterium]